MFGCRRECARDHEVCWLWFRQQALAVDALVRWPVRRETVRQTGQADPQPQDDISISRPSSAHAATRAAGATPEGKLVSLQPITLTNDRCSITTTRIAARRRLSIQSCKPSRKIRTGQAPHRHAVGYARPGAVPGLYATDRMNELAVNSK